MTTKQPKLERWAQEFDEEFRNGATNTVRNLAIKSFIRATLAFAIKEKVEEVRKCLTNAVVVRDEVCIPEQDYQSLVRTFSLNNKE